MTQKIFYGSSLLAIFVIGLLSGCSPYVYKNEVVTFNEAIVQTSATFDEQRDFLTQAGLAIKQNALVEAGNPRLVISDQCIETVTCLQLLVHSPIGRAQCVQNHLGIQQSNTEEFDIQEVYVALQNEASKSCNAITAEGGLPVEEPIAVEVQRTVMDGLSTYGNALAGIVDAQDQTDLQAATTAACSSSQELFGAVASINLDETSGELTAEEKKAIDDRKKTIVKQQTAVNDVCGLVGTIGGGILDRKRLKALKQAVNEAEPSVFVLSEYLKGVSRKINGMIIRHEFDAYVDSVNNTATTEKETYLTAVNAAVGKKNAFVPILTNNSVNVFAQMSEAHTKLKNAINDPETQRDAAIASIVNFSKSAQDAHKALEALREKEDSK